MTTSIDLTVTEKEDLDAFFKFQLNKEARHLAAFTNKDSNDKTAYIERYSKYLSEPSIHMRTIKVDNTIVGSISKFMIGDEAELTYWIDRQSWGQGIGTAALKDFLEIENTRPIYGRVAFDNYGSQRVLEKCGFIRIATDKGFANERQVEVEEFIYKLEK
ncbi:GNAT family N-acetyltransferase [Pedobacter sp. PWIIR3]